MANNELKIKLSAEGASAVEQALARIGDRVDAFSSRIAAMGHLSVAGVGIDSLAAKFTHLVDAADGINDLSQKIGISVRDLGGWQLAAAQSGASLESVGKGVKSLSTYMVEHGESLRKVGIDTSDANVALTQLADLFAALPDDMEKSALATKLLGKAGADLIPLLNLGSNGLKEAQDKAAAYAERLAELAPNADKFNDQLAELKLNSDAAAMSLASDLLPALTGVAAFLNDIAQGGDKAREAMAWLADSNLMPGQVRLGMKAGLLVKDALAWGEGSLDGVDGVEARRRAAWQQRGWGDTAFAGDLQFDWAGNARLVEQQKAKQKAAALLAGPKSAKKPSAGMGFDYADDIAPAGWGKELEAARNRIKALGEEFARDNAKRTESMQIMSASAVRLAEAMRGIDEKAASTSKEFDRLLASGTISTETYAQMMDELTVVTEKQREQVEALLAAQDKLNGSWEYGASKALRGYLDEVENVSRSTEQLMSNAFRGMEDALTEFVMTGKLSFTDLANSIVRDLIRIQIQQSVTKPLAEFGASFLFGGLPSDGVGASGNRPGTGFSGVSSNPGFFERLFPNANGNVFASDSLHRYANTIVSSPTLFKFAQGGAFRTGLMGEAGPEAIMPLTRVGGKLGVRAEVGAGGTAPPVTVNVINQGGQSLTAQQREPRFDGEQWVVDVVLTRMDTDPGFRAAMGR